MPLEEYIWEYRKVETCLEHTEDKSFEKQNDTHPIWPRTFSILTLKSLSWEMPQSRANWVVGSPHEDN